MTPCENSTAQKPNQIGCHLILESRKFEMPRYRGLARVRVSEPTFKRIVFIIIIVINIILSITRYCARNNIFKKRVLLALCERK